MAGLSAIGTAKSVSVDNQLSSLLLLWHFRIIFFAFYFLQYFRFVLKKLCYCYSELYYYNCNHCCFYYYHFCCGFL